MPQVSVLKNMFQSLVAPGDDAEFLRFLTEADMRLLSWGRWQWTKAKVTLHPASGIITLPASLASILGAQVDTYARDIRSVEFQFVADGVGEVAVDGLSNVMLIDLGLDDTGARTYKVSGNLPDTATVVALCHKAPVTLYDPTLVDDSLPDDATDVTVCPDSAALKNCCIAIVQEEQNEPETSSKYMAIALAILDSKEKQARGGARQQVNLRPNGPGISPIRYFR